MSTLAYECAPRGGNAAVLRANERKHEAAMQLMYLFTSKRSEAAMPQGVPVRTFVLARAEKSKQQCNRSLARLGRRLKIYKCTSMARPTSINPGGGSTERDKPRP